MVTNVSILRKARVDSVDVTARQYRLRWLGHVGRMVDDPQPPASAGGVYTSRRLPLQMLSAWLDGPRPVGAPPKAWGKMTAGDVSMCQLPALGPHDPRRWASWIQLCQRPPVGVDWEKLVDSLRGSITAG